MTWTLYRTERASLPKPPKIVRGWDGLPRIEDKRGPLWLTHPYFRKERQL